jgi:dihydrofolate reductase
MPPRISLVAAVARNGVIGDAGRLPWHLPEDLKRFKTLTMGHVMIMGRRTHESIGRPLPGRRTIVVSRQAGLDLPGVEVASSLEAAIALAGEVPEIFVVGGGEIYAQALPLAHRLLLTEVEATPTGDAFFPAFDRRQWRVGTRTEGRSAAGLGYTFVDYERAA